MLFPLAPLCHLFSFVTNMCSTQSPDQSRVYQELVASSKKETKKVEEGVISLYRGPLIAAFIRLILWDSLWHVTLTSRTN